MMRFGVFCFIVSFTVMDRCHGILERNEAIKTKRELVVSNKKLPGTVREYELLLQVAYRDSNEKNNLKNYLKLLKPPLSYGPLEIIRVKATTYCSSLNGTLQCACEDDYTWFPPTCLDPQKCKFHTAGSLQSCSCHLSNLSQSINFCEKAKIWGSFKINENFTEDLLNSSSATYSKYATGIEIQLAEAYKGIQGFESVRVTQFREGSIIAGFEVIGSNSPSELLSATKQVAEKAEAALHRMFPLEDDSLTVFEKADCSNNVFGFGSKNDEYIVPCDSGYTGNIKARCQSSGWQVIRENCVLFQLEELKKNFSAIAGNATNAAVSSLVQKLSVIVEESATTAGNLASVVSLLANVSSLSLTNHLTVSSSTMKNIINITDHILNSTSGTSWTVLLQEEKDAGSVLLKTLEDISTLVPPSALPLNFSGEFINWRGISVTNNSQLQEGYKYHAEMSSTNTSNPIKGTVFINASQFLNSSPETIISMASSTLGNILPNTKNGNAVVNGPVISTIIHNYSVNEILLSFSKIESNLSQPQCVFWDFSHFQWNTSGCHLVNETADRVTCRCTHLTSFSFLMSPFVPTAIIPVVQWITFVGLGISIGSLVLCLIIEALFWKQFKKNQTSHTRHICIVNIALSLLIADVWFIVAATVTTTANPTGICIAAVFLTHFFYLSLFFWMFTLGILLTYSIILVFHHMTMPLMTAVGFSMGYGCPLVISVITIAVTQPSNVYKRKDAVCWLNWSDESKPLLAFIIPALTIVVMNLLVVLLVLTKLRRPAVGERMNRDDKTTVIRMGKGLLVLTPLLGLTWGFGIGTLVDSQNLAWHVIFAVFNAFQGFFILCFGMLLDSKLRQLLLNKLSPLLSWKQSSKQTSTDLSTKSKFSKVFNLLKHKGTYAFSRTGDSSNDVTLTQFSSTEQDQEP